MTRRILIIEDDNQIRNFNCFAVENMGLEYTAAANGAEATAKLLSERVDLILLDLGLPDMDGMEIIKKVREWSEMPIIVVSARDQDKEKAAALDAGANDYLTKPFSATELSARIRVALRHLERHGESTQETVKSVGGLRIELDRHLVYLDGEELHLTPMEYNLLALFFRNIGKVLTSAYIIRQVWGAGYGSDTQSLRALMASLRRKIEKSPAQPRYLVTEVGVGYRLVDE